MLRSLQRKSQPPVHVPAINRPYRSENMGDAQASSDPHSPRFRTRAPEAASPQICLIVRSRPYDQAAVLSAVLRRGYSPVETTIESLEAVLATVTPQVVIAVADPARSADREVIARVSETGAFVLFLAPSIEYFPLGLAAGADACLEDAAVESALAAQLSAFQRRVTLAEQARAVGVLPLAEGVGLDLDAHRLVAPGRTVHLTPFEYALLEALGRQPGRVVSAVSLIEMTRGYIASEVEAGATVKAYIRRLRRKIDEAGGDPSIIVTVRGAGYMIDRPG